MSWSQNARNAAIAVQREKCMLSTMQWLVAENNRLRKTGEIDAIVCWSCVNALVWFSVWEIAGGIFK